ncbi:MAG: hypothetical protein K2O88_04205 [Paramuribaculum sp.]|nr:hypothetical protein [Paramuribaculum sp.]
MHKTSTPKSPSVSAKQSATQHAGPSDKTIAFLKQFARAYTHLPSGKPQLAGFIAN